MILLEAPPRLNTGVPPEDFGTLSDYVVDLAEYLETLRQQIGRLLPLFNHGEATYDPPNLVDGAGTTTTVTVPGALLGDKAMASFSLDVQGITVTADVSAANTVAVRFQNETGGAVDLASGTLRAWAFRPPVPS